LVAAALINFTGGTAAIGFTHWFTSFERSAPLAYQLKFSLVVYVISCALFYLGPALLLWNVYRGVIGHLRASLVTIDPSSLRLRCLPSSSSRTMLIVWGVAFVLLVFLALAILLVVARKLLSC